MPGLKDSKESQNILVIILISYLLISANIGGLYIYSLDEAKNSECAREMIERGDPIVPTFNYELRTDKPPLHYYFMIAAYSVFGVNEFSARFFSVIFGVLTVLITYLFARRFACKQIAVLSVVILLSSLHFSLQFHMAVPDPYLIFFMTASFYAFYIFMVTGKKSYLFLLYISLALGSLAKGPVAVALPGMAFLAYIIVSGRFSWETIKSFQLIRGILLFLIIALPWYLAVAYKTDGEWIYQFFFKHNLDRYTSTMEGHGAIFLVTPAMILVGLLPFSIFFIQAFKFSWQQRKENDVFLFAAIVVSVITIFFSLSSTKLPNYTVPAYPLFAIMLGGAINRIITKRSRNMGNTIGMSIYTLLAVAIPIVLFLFLKEDKYFSHLSTQSWWFLFISAGAVAGLFMYLTGRISQGLITIAVSWMITTMVFFHHVFPQFDRENPVAKSLPYLDQDQEIRGYKLFNASFVFYLKKHIPRLTTKEDLNDFVKENPGGQIITRTRYEDDYSQVNGLEEVTRHKDIFEIPTTIILKAQD